MTCSSAAASVRASSRRRSPTARWPWWWASGSTRPCVRMATAGIDLHSGARVNFAADEFVNVDKEVGVGFPDSVLTSDEKVVLHLHPHWKALIRPILVLVVGLTLVIAAAIYLPDQGW